MQSEEKQNIEQELHTVSESPDIESNPPSLSKAQKQRILSVLFSRLLQMHKSIMTVFIFVHVIIIIAICLHMFSHGTIESENSSCYLTWPLHHLYYVFMNYLFAWFFCYNSCEIKSKKGHQLLIVSKKFIKIIFIFSFVPVFLKLLTDNFCRNWSFSWESVAKAVGHIFGECVLLFVYFSWFEKKYTGFRIFYKESIF